MCIHTYERTLKLIASLYSLMFRSKIKIQILNSHLCLLWSEYQCFLVAFANDIHLSLNENDENEEYIDAKQ